MLAKTSHSIATVLIGGLPFFSSGCSLIEIVIGLLTFLAYGSVGEPYIANSCPSDLICQAADCLVVGQNGSFERGREIEEIEGRLDPIRPNAWRPGGRSLVAHDRSCQGQYGLHLHGADTTIRQAYQLIDLTDLFPPTASTVPRRLRAGASFMLTGASVAVDFKLTLFTFSGLDPQSFPEAGDPYAFAAQATSIETTSRNVTLDARWKPIQTTQTLPPEVDVVLVLLEYELTGNLNNANLYVDGVEIFLDTGPYGPHASADAATTLLDTPVAIDVLRNDSDPDGVIDPATLRVVTGPTHGTTAIDEEGLVTYTPDTGYTGSDRFTYAFTDADGLNAGAPATIDILPGNRRPVAVADTVTTAPGTAIDIDVLANDSDPDGDALAVFAIGDPPNGTAEVIDGGQAVRYTPNAGFTGNDGFAYIIADEHGAQSNEVEVAIIVQ